MPSATYIVARSHPDHVIGVDNRLPWRLKTDLQPFKRRTMGHAIVMGRKTLESIGNRPLPGRLNIVLSRTPIAEREGLQWARDPETALLLADAYSIINRNKQFFVIGGEKIYDVFFKYVNTVWLTEVFCGRINGDAKFPYEFPTSDWRTPFEWDFPKSEVDEWGFRISWRARRKPQHRERSKEEFIKVDPAIVATLEGMPASPEDVIAQLEAEAEFAFD
jgi:dihydrofolate reductase